jgi:hypothetical protein
MRIESVAAVALTGWYVMRVPPDYQPYSRTPLPISRWATRDSFHSADRCTKRKMRFLAADQQRKKWQGTKVGLHLALLRTFLSPYFIS